jgi:hypothetical protein
VLRGAGPSVLLSALRVPAPVLVRERDTRWERRILIGTVLLTSDPHQWLQPFYATLKADPTFHTLAMPLRFAALCDVVEVEHPERASWMRQWSPAAQEGTLKWLDSATKEKPTITELELWTVKKAKRTLRCVARYLQIGIDLRLMEGDDFRRTELHKNADLAEVRSVGWRQALEERGWK